MKFQETEIEGLYIINQYVSRDSRGVFAKNFNFVEFEKHKIECCFKESYYTTSEKNVIRGMHFQIPPHDHAKLITVISGQIIDVVLDLRKTSSTYGQVFSFELSSENYHTLYISRGLAHGFGVLSETAITSYQVTSVYNPDHDTGLLYSSINFEWPIVDPIISERDRLFSKLEDFQSPF